MKRIFCLFLVLSMVLGMTAFAAEADPKYDVFTTVANGNFENGLSDWIKAGDGTIEPSAEETAEGGQSLYFQSQAACYVYQKIYIVGGAEYTLSLQAKGDKGTKGAIKIEYSDTYNSERKGEEWLSFECGGRKWEKHEKTFTVPEGANFGVFLVRLMSAGEMYIDDVYMDGPIATENESNAKAFEEKKIARIEKEPLPGTGDVMVNGSYEELGQDGYPANLETFDKWGTYANVVGGAQDGEYCIEINAPEPKYPWVRHNIYNLVGGARYQVIFYYKSDNDNFGTKFEFYGQQDTANPFYAQVEPGKYPASRDWTRVVYSVVVPERAEYMSFYVRNYDKNGGTCYVDNLVMYMTEAPDEFNSGVWTDGVFYYPQITEGYATVTLNQVYDGAKYTADFALLDGETVLQKADDVPFVDNVARWDYTIGELAMEKQYVVRAQVVNAAGEPLTFEQNIYRANRPELIDENGVCYDLEGNVFDPLICYHVGEGNYADAAAGGINVIQGKLIENPDEYVAWLDEMDALGLKVAIPFYYNMKPAGHPENINTVKKVVEAVKDHPALFGYLTMDEPFGHGDKLEMMGWLETSYKEIHAIDKKHPIMSCECFANFLSENIKFVDLLIIDPYPGVHNPYLTHVGDFGKKAMVAAEYAGGKPVLNLLQTFTFNYGAPKVGEVRHMAYQSYLTGQQYVGWYPWTKEGQVDTVNVDESIWYPEMVQFAKEERPILAKHFAEKAEPTFNKYSDSTVSYETWVSGSDVYLALINHTYDKATATVSLKSTNGQVTLSDVKSEILFGENVNITAAADGLELSLVGADCLLVKLTPSSPVDTALLSLAAFSDLDSYAWAEAAIMEIFEKGIANTRGEGLYAPGEAITRGEFAMFLIRTLGLSGEAGEQFADVDPAAEYAKELAIGRAAGILNGVGDNKFNPEATITRQDMMTIISRGMALSGEGDLSAFSDAAQIADYALSHVSAMIASGLIQGNADGTINPLGNTTRAETAVIMQRILNR